MELVNDSSSRSISTGIFDWNLPGSDSYRCVTCDYDFNNCHCSCSITLCFIGNRKHTPIDEMIKSQVTNTMAKAAASQLTGGSDDNGSTGISAEVYESIEGSRD